MCLSILLNINNSEKVVFNSIFHHLSYNLSFVIYILIGCLFFQYHIKQISIYCLSMATSCLTLIFITFYSLYSAKSTIPFPYVLALIFFSLPFFINFKWEKLTIINHLANISYPIYILHYVPGKNILNYCIQYKIPSPISVIITSTVILLLAYLAHIFIEKPMIKYSKT